MILALLSGLASWKCVQTALGGSLTLRVPPLFLKKKKNCNDSSEYVVIYCQRLGACVCWDRLRPVHLKTRFPSRSWPGTK